MLMMSLAGAGLLAMTLLGAQVEASTLGGYDRAKVADANYRALHGDRAFPLEETDPEYAAMMKKYIYGDICAAGADYARRARACDDCRADGQSERASACKCVGRRIGARLLSDLGRGAA